MIESVFIKNAPYRFKRLLKNGSMQRAREDKWVPHCVRKTLIKIRTYSRHWGHGCVI